MTIAEFLTTLRANVAQTDITLCSAADKRLIHDFERQLNLTLPADFRAFYSCCDGFESAEDLFRMVPLAEILEGSNDFLPPRHFVIAEYLTYCDMWEVEFWGLSPDSYRIFHIHKGQKVVLTDSLAAFLNRFLQGGVFEQGGLYQWSEELNPPLNPEL